MLTKVKLDCFKRFDNETFELGDDVVLAGPNNSGKTTLLQAVATWYLALQRWLSEHAESSKAKQRTGVPVSRNDFTAIPLREMNLLWFDRDTAYSKDEREGTDAGQPKLVAISLFGKTPGQADWDLTVTLRYTNKEQIYVKLANEVGQSRHGRPSGRLGDQDRSRSAVLGHRGGGNRAPIGLSEPSCGSGQARRHLEESSARGVSDGRKGKDRTVEGTDRGRVWTLRLSPQGSTVLGSHRSFHTDRVHPREIKDRL